MALAAGEGCLWVARGRDLWRLEEGRLHPQDQHPGWDLGEAGGGGMAVDPQGRLWLAAEGRFLRRNPHGGLREAPVGAEFPSYPAFDGEGKLHFVDLKERLIKVRFTDI